MLIVVNTEKDSLASIEGIIGALQAHVVGARGRAAIFKEAGFSAEIKAPAAPLPPPAPSAPIAPDDRPDTGIPNAADAFGAPLTGAPLAPPAPPHPSPETVFGDSPAAPQPPAPPAPLPPGAPVAAPPAPGGQQAATVLDKNGLPWDERIHSSNRKQTAKGVWMAKRGLNDAAIVTQVEAELRALMAIPPGTPAAPQPPAPPAPLPPGAPVAAPPAPGGASDAIAGSDPTTFAMFMTRVTPLINAQTCTNSQINQACAEAGVSGGPALLAPRPDLIPSVWANLRRIAGF